MDKIYSNLLESLRVYYETEKDELQKSKETYDFELGDFVMCVMKDRTKGLFCLRGKIEQFDQDESFITAYAIDIGFVMKVRKKNIYRLPDKFANLEPLMYEVIPEGVKITDLEIVGNVLKELVTDRKVLESKFLSTESPYHVHIPELNDRLIRKGFNSQFLSDY